MCVYNAVKANFPEQYSSQVKYKHRMLFTLRKILLNVYKTDDFEFFFFCRVLLKRVFLIKKFKGFKSYECYLLVFPASPRKYIQYKTEDSTERVKIQT